MRTSRKVQLQLLAQNTLFALLLVAAAVLTAYLLRENKLQWDVTLNKRTSLSQAARDVLERIEGPVSITAYATTQDAMCALRSGTSSLRSSRPSPTSP
jgi:uncharacterized membrane protein